MKVVSLIVALALALASGAPAQTATFAGAGEAVVSAAQPAAGRLDTTATTQSNDDSAAPGLSTYVLLALGLFGMGLVSRRRQAD